MAMNPRPHRDPAGASGGYADHPLSIGSFRLPPRPALTRRPSPIPRPGSDVARAHPRRIHRPLGARREPLRRGIPGPSAPRSAADAVELIYHEYLPGRVGRPRTPTRPITSGGSPRQGDRSGGSSPSTARSALRGSGTGPIRRSLPEVGDEIGPYLLIRELGRGGFARVFLAEQADLDHRLVVVKVSTRITAEPRLLARARHPHIVEVLWHGVADDGALQLICMPFLGGATLCAVLAGRGGAGGGPRSGRDLLADPRPGLRPGVSHGPSSSGRPARSSPGSRIPKAIAWIVARLAEALDHAYGRGVAHGDLKPSNVLLTAEACRCCSTSTCRSTGRMPRTPACRWTRRDARLHGPRAAPGHRRPDGTRPRPRPSTATGPTSTRWASCSWRP